MTSLAYQACASNLVKEYHPPAMPKYIIFGLSSKKMVLYRLFGVNRFGVLSRSSSLMNGKWCLYPVQRMMASTSAVEPSLKWQVLLRSSTYSNNGTVFKF